MAGESKSWRCILQRERQTDGPSDSHRKLACFSFTGGRIPIERVHVRRAEIGAGGRDKGRDVRKWVPRALPDNR